MATRPLSIALTFCAGLAAIAIGWYAGNELFVSGEPAAEDSVQDIAEAAANVSVLVKTLPSANRDGKQDKANAENDAALRGPLSSYADNPPPSVVAMPPPMRPNDVLKGAKPSRAYLNDTQIAGIKSRLKLSRAQEKYWPPVETSLRGVIAQISDYQARAKRSRDATFDTDSADIQQLKSSAKALYAQLRGDQKSEVITLATMAGMGPIVTAALDPPKPVVREAPKETPKETASEE